MTEEQKEVIRNYKFPKYYSLLYKAWKYFLRYALVGLFVVILVLMIVYNETRFDNFNLVRGFVFGAFGIGLLMLTAFLTKGAHLKRYLKKNGMSLLEWNIITTGMTIDDINNF